MDQRQNSIIVNLEDLQSELFALIDEPTFWGLDGFGLSREKGFVVGSMPFTIIHSLEADPICLQVMVIIDVKGLMKLVGYPDKSRLMSQYVTRYKPENKDYPIDIQVHAKSKRNIFFQDCPDSIGPLKDCRAMKEHMLFQLLYYTDFPKFLNILQNHFYQDESGLCLSEIISEIENNQDAWNKNDGIPALSMERSGEWMVHWRYINGAWTRDFFHELPISTKRFARYQGEPISRILDRLIGVPIDELADNTTHMLEMRNSLAKDKLNATY